MNKYEMFISKHYDNRMEEILNTHTPHTYKYPILPKTYLFIVYCLFFDRGWLM